MIKFIRKLIIDVFFILLFYILYKNLGFEITIIIAIALICSYLAQNSKSWNKPNVHTVYSPQRNKVKFN